MNISKVYYKIILNRIGSDYSGTIPIPELVELNRVYRENKIKTKWIHEKIKTKDLKRKCDATKTLKKVQSMAPEYDWVIQEYCYGF